MSTEQQRHIPPFRTHHTLTSDSDAFCVIPKFIWNDRGGLGTWGSHALVNKLQECFSLNDLLHATSGTTGALVTSCYLEEAEFASSGLGLHAATSNSTGSTLQTLPRLHQRLVSASRSQISCVADVQQLLSEFQLSESAQLHAGCLYLCSS